MSLFTLKWKGYMFGVSKKSRVVSGRKENYSLFKLKYVLGAGANGFELTEQF